MKNIIVAGYPKSGNTWITRLTAELLESPVVGFWQFQHQEMAKEGLERISDFRCYKAHQQLHELGDVVKSEEHCIIYVIRDPRDVAVSGAHYFNIERFQVVYKLFRCIPKGGSLYKRTLYRMLNPFNYRIERMIEAVIHGSSEVHHWCRISWKNHFCPYWENNILIVRYEDMLKSPINECRKILDYVGEVADDKKIFKTVENQSFENKKKELIDRGDEIGAAFMRSGRSGQWKDILSEKQKRLFYENLSEELHLLAYEA